MNIAFGTVTYKESFKYCLEFTESINKQDCKDFDVILLNDNLDKEELEKISASLRKNVLIRNGKRNCTPSGLRVQLIKYAKENGYDLLVLGDFDDTFSHNRVSRIALAYEEKYSFYYNDIYTFDKQRKFFSSLSQYTKNISDIIEHNYLGLSNTALNLKNIDVELIDKLNVRSVSVFDWFMYSILLKGGHIGKKIEDCKTYYRIHENNIAGESQNTIEGIKKEINVKIDHYSQLRSIDTQFNKLLDYYKRLKLKIDNDKIDILNYVDSDNGYWWGRINSNKMREERTDCEY
ncbi:MAG: glycosyltransferase [Clostridiaceae bacterium]|nr:glycosyltransferase [Clostridiaceae bacterium]